MATENPTWGAPRINGEVRILGLEVSERTVSRYLPRRPRHPDAVARWLVFLRNLRDAIAAMDFFIVPTVTFRVLYVWFAMEHGRRRVLRLAVTEHPGASRLILQLREAFPLDTAPRPTRTACRSPWQNGVAERWVGSVRRELLDHVVVLGERDLGRLLREYVAYYHDDRTHLGLRKATPAGRLVTRRQDGGADVVARSVRARFFEEQPDRRCLRFDNSVAVQCGVALLLGSLRTSVKPSENSVRPSSAISSV